MSNTSYTAVDAYIDDLFGPADPVLVATQERAAGAGLPDISVSAAQGRLLHVLALACGARSILEIGTLGGYSTIWLASALPADGRMVTLEYDQRHADVARANLARAGLADRVEVRVGPALDTLPRLALERHGPFDLTFIDADKENNPQYFRWALQLSGKGSLIIVDNVVRGGKVADPYSDDPDVVGTRKLIDALAAEPRVSATAIQTVGSKSYDGFAIALVVS